jgi:two-component system nitrogen regulation response regulator GlnG
MSRSAARVWIVDDDASIRRVLARALEGAGWSGREFDSVDAVLAALEVSDRPQVLISDLRMPGRSGLDLLEALADNARAREIPAPPVIVMTAYADLDNSVEVLRAGAFELLPKPFDLDQALALVERAAAASQRSAPMPPASSSLIGSAPAMKELFRLIARLSGSELSVLLTGESGTGKERIARALHDSSPRASGPFVALNVAALPAELLESELFGHEKGAFSGAVEARAGYFEQAAGGTLFLDEIGEMPAPLQTRLLRVLAEGEFHRLGGRRACKADVRIIAATNRDLARAVAEGRFRDDLFHRLDGVELKLPPLRERREDVPLLLQHYLAAAARELDLPTKHIAPDALQALCAHAWPGNIRELVNLCRRLTVLVPGPEIRCTDLPAAMAGRAEAPGDDWDAALRRWARRRLAEGGCDLMAEAVGRLEQILIDEALAASGDRRAEAAGRLGIGRNTLSRKLDR